MELDEEDLDDSFEIARKEMKNQRKVEQFGIKMTNYYTHIQKHSAEINNKIRSSMMKMKSKRMD